METGENLFGTWDPAGTQVATLNLDNSEEEIEVEGDGVAFGRHEGPEGYSEEEDEEAEVDNTSEDGFAKAALCNNPLSLSVT